MVLVNCRVIIAVSITVAVILVVIAYALALPKNSGKQYKAVSHPEFRLSVWERAAGVKDQELLWPDAVVPYTIVGVYTERDRNMIESAMKDISDKTCIIFKKRTNETDYVHIENDVGEGCFALEGRQGGNQTVSLEAPMCLLFMGSVQHELLHTLGVIHEHSRPDRDEYIDIIWDNVKPDEKYQFRFNSWDDIQNLSIPYDYDSLMHYGTKAFSINRSDTMVPKVNTTIVHNVTKGMSANDYAFLNLLYKCNTTLNDTDTVTEPPNKQIKNNYK